MVDWQSLELSNFVFQMVDFNFDIYKLIHGGKRYSESISTWTHFLVYINIVSGQFGAFIYVRYYRNGL